MHMKRFQNRPTYASINGFTMTELMVVIGIVAILVSIAAPLMSHWMIKVRVEQEIEQMYSDLVNTRARAMNYNRIQFLQLNLVQNQYQTYDDTFPAPDGDGILTPGSDTLVISTITKDQMWVNPAGFLQLQFDNRGIISGTGTIGLTNLYLSIYDCISVSPTRIRIGRWNGTNCIQVL